MTTTQNAAGRYHSQAVQTAAGPQLLVMLYDRLAADIDIAEQFLGAGNLQGTNETLQHAQKIVRMLRHSLQPDRFEGGHDLLSLYEFLYSRLVEANLTKDPEKIRECRRIVAPLREAWHRAVANPEASNVQ